MVLLGIIQKIWYLHISALEGQNNMGTVNYLLPFHGLGPRTQIECKSKVNHFESAFQAASTILKEYDITPKELINLIFCPVDTDLLPEPMKKAMNENQALNALVSNIRASIKYEKKFYHCLLDLLPFQHARLSASGNKLLAYLAACDNPACIKMTGYLDIEQTKKIIRSFFCNGSLIAFDNYALSNISFSAGEQSLCLMDHNGSPFTMGNTSLQAIRPHLDYLKDPISGKEAFMDINLNEPPKRNDEMVLNYKNSAGVAFGDMHGNLIMALHQLVQLGVIEEFPPDVWKTIKAALGNGIQGQDKLKDLLEMHIKSIGLQDEIDIEPKRKRMLLYVGDVIGDRCGNEFKTSCFFTNLIKKHKLNIHLRAGNHDVESTKGILDNDARKIRFYDSEGNETNARGLLVDRNGRFISADRSTTLKPTFENKEKAAISAIKTTEEIYNPLQPYIDPDNLPTTDAEAAIQIRSRAKPGLYRSLFALCNALNDAGQLAGPGNKVTRDGFFLDMRETILPRMNLVGSSPDGKCGIIHAPASEELFLRVFLQACGKDIPESDFKILEAKYQEALGNPGNSKKDNPTCYTNEKEYFDIRYAYDCMTMDTKNNVINDFWQSLISPDKWGAKHLQSALLDIRGDDTPLMQFVNIRLRDPQVKIPQIIGNYKKILHGHTESISQQSVEWRTQLEAIKKFLIYIKGIKNWDESIKNEKFAFEFIGELMKLAVLGPNTTDTLTPLIDLVRDLFRFIADKMDPQRLKTLAAANEFADAKCAVIQREQKDDQKDKEIAKLILTVSMPGSKVTTEGEALLQGELAKVQYDWLTDKQKVATNFKDKELAYQEQLARKPSGKFVTFLAKTKEIEAIRAFEADLFKITTSGSTKDLREKLDSLTTRLNDPATELGYLTWYGLKSAMMGAKDWDTDFTRKADASYMFTLLEYIESLRMDGIELPADSITKLGNLKNAVQSFKAELVDSPVTKRNKNILKKEFKEIITQLAEIARILPDNELVFQKITSFDKNTIRDPLVDKASEHMGIDAIAIQPFIKTEITWLMRLLEFKTSTPRNSLSLTFIGTLMGRDVSRVFSEKELVEEELEKLVTYLENKQAEFNKGLTKEQKEKFKSTEAYTEYVGLDNIGGKDVDDRKVIKPVHFFGRKFVSEPAPIKRNPAPLPPLPRAR
ncbi:hypothetical protein FNU76_11440 [Chitinimonas arctica]|uniref:Uncharacterized protein n=1 Tax=Chitinimonas arctica TaxID=2594795 RepID=A0A516SFI3_9NEIS|nr:hypothetical protein [Chitinimonas arctica]QDQ26925.1 hypothetical protein FNU76_11440 [Chitinimonas arctica]